MAELVLIILPFSIVGAVLFTLYKNEIKKAMKASELMIGDFIMTPLQKGTVVGNIEEIETYFDAPDECHITCDVRGFRAGFNDNSGVRPIPLTEEILQKYGFERKQRNGCVSYGN